MSYITRTLGKSIFSSPEFQKKFSEAMAQAKAIKVAPTPATKKVKTTKADRKARGRARGKA